MSAFVPLRVRSHGSLLHGTASPEALIERALALGYGTLALTDRDNLYLAIRFYQRARADGLAPLIGAELTFAPHAALLLPLDRRGYANLCRLLTLRHLDPAFDAIASLAGLWRGLHVVVESPGLAASLLAAGVPAARSAAGPARTGGHDGGGGLWLGVRGLAAERARLGERAAAARRLGVPLVATADCVMLAPGDHPAHVAAVAAAAGELIERLPPGACCAREAWLAPPAEWARRVRATCAGAGRPEAAEEALANNAALVARCRLALELGTPIFPRAPVPEGETGPGYLMRLGRAGIERRYGGPARANRTGAARAVARLDEELALIRQLGFTDYFLLVADIVEFARARGIPTVGRGSGAGSIVAYALGITNVDPLRYGLYFERFLHPARRDCPDLDIDLCWRRRDEVIQHVYDTYGAEQVAMISTHATLGARSAFRETAKALGVPNARVNALARRVPREMEKPYLQRLVGLAEARGVDWREAPLPEALRLAEALDGAPRHLSIHCGGVVIGDRPLTHYVPLERAAKGIVVSQFEMRAIEAVGLVKMDLLGNRALTTIGECVSLVRDQRGIAPDVESLPDPEPATAARLSTGDTLNCFQLESPAMRHLLRMLRARTLDETIAAVALVRPGPAESGMKEAFCRRHRGLEPPAFLHPRLERVLGGTHGVLLYEEDVMCVAAALTGLSLAEGDQLRRAIAAARGDGEFRALEAGFVAQAGRSGVEEATARAAWRELTRFAAYAFCKAHAAGYGTLAYQCTYLKTHFPTEFAVGILNHHAGMYPTWVHVEDLRRSGVSFRGPCVWRSSWDSTLEVDGAPRQMDEAPREVDRAPREVDRAPREVDGAPREIDGAPREVDGRRGGEGPPPRARSARHPASLRCPEARSASPWLPLASDAPGAEVPRPRARLTGLPDNAPAHAPPVHLRGNALAPAPAARVGLSRVFGLARATGERIVTARAEGPFRSLADLIDRVRPTLPEVESLILAGALDGSGRSRPSLLLEARAGARAWAAGGRAPGPAAAGGAGLLLATEPVPAVSVPELPEFDLARRVRGEIQASGLWFSGHPLDTVIPTEAARGSVPAASLPERVGRRVAVVGLPCAYRRVETKSGERMLFMTLADRSGLAECVLFPAAYRANVAAIRGQVVRAEGRVDESLGAVTLVTERARALVD
jgi:DNA polymerase III alpha subunit